jgi:hypothetical protein
MTEAEPRPEAISALRKHPGFQAAMRVAAGGTVSLYRSNRVLNSLMNDRARALFTHIALYLHYSGMPGGKPGLTVGAMRDICAELRLCSPGRCEAMVALMRAAGFFKAAPSADKRRRLLVPTGKLLALHRERWRAHLEAMRLVMPEAERYLAALNDEVFVKAFVVSLVEKFIAGLRILDHAPGLELFAERNAGVVILFSLALAGPLDGPFPPAAPVPLSLNALATTFSVSRKHVLTLLRDAEAQSLLARGGAANDRITILPPARDALESLFATMFLYLAQCAEDGLHAGEKTVALRAVLAAG